MLIVAKKEAERERERDDYEKYNVTTVVMEWIKLVTEGLRQALK